MLLAGAICAIGCFAVLQSLAEVISGYDAERAHRLAPWHARIMGEVAQARVSSASVGLVEGQPGTEKVANQLADAKSLASAALRDDATVGAAATTLGLVADLNGDVDDARRWMIYSEKLSRRDLSSQLWLAEDAVRHDDIPGALRHYDIVLRTKRAASDLLFPILASAIAEPSVSAELVRTLSAKPRWAEAFMLYAATEGANPAATASLFVSLERARIYVSPSAESAVVNALIARQQFDAAWNYYASVRRGVDRRRSRDPDFTAMPARPSQLDWMPVPSESGIMVSIQGSGDGAMADISAPSSVGGPMLQQLQLLPPGRYTVGGQSSGIDQPDSSLPYWLLTCLADGRELGRVVLPNSSERAGRFAGILSVPNDCPAQNLVFVGRSSNKVEGLNAQIRRVELRPARSVQSP